MAIETVVLTADAVWQDGTPFSGVLEITLQATETASDAVVAPKKAQEVYFTDGRAEISLVPSSAINGAKYRIRVITTAVEGNYKSKTALCDELVEIPNTDCTLQELLAAASTASSSEETQQEPGGE